MQDVESINAGCALAMRYVSAYRAFSWAGEFAPFGLESCLPGRERGLIVISGGVGGKRRFARTPYGCCRDAGCVMNCALTGRWFQGMTLPRALPWAGEFCPFGLENG